MEVLPITYTLGVYGIVVQSRMILLFRDKSFVPYFNVNKTGSFRIIFPHQNSFVDMLVNVSKHDCTENI